MSRNAIMLEAGLVNLTFFQSRNEGYTILSQYRWKLRVLEGEKMARLCAYAKFQPKYKPSHHVAATRGTHGIVFTPHT
jgi:hypothetical protein